MRSYFKLKIGNVHHSQKNIMWKETKPAEVPVLQKFGQENWEN